MTYSITSQTTKSLKSTDNVSHQSTITLACSTSVYKKHSWASILLVNWNHKTDRHQQVTQSLHFTVARKNEWFHLSVPSWWLDKTSDFKLFTRKQDCQFLWETTHQSVPYQFRISYASDNRTPIPSACLYTQSKAANRPSQTSVGAPVHLCGGKTAAGARRNPPSS